MRPGGVAADMVEWRSREKIDGILEETLADPAVLQRTYPMGWYGKGEARELVRGLVLASGKGLCLYA